MHIRGVIRAMGVCGAALVAAGCVTTAVLEQELTKTNTQTVLAFEATIYNKHDAAGAFFHYVGTSFIQHDPQPVEGKDSAEQAYNQLVTQQFPSSRLMIERSIAQGDLVATQGDWQRKPGERGVPVVNIYRLRNGRIIEHWDVVQDGMATLAGVQGLL